MLSLVDQMSKMGGFAAISFIIILLFGIREGYNFVLQVLEIFNVYHKNEQKKADHDEMIKNLNSNVDNLTKRLEIIEDKVNSSDCKEKIPELENAMSEKDNQIQSIITDLNEIKLALKNADDERKRNAITNAKNTMYRLWFEARTNGYVTQASLENFLTTADTYLSHGGNSYYKKVIIPSYLDFPIKDVVDEHAMMETNSKVQDVKDKVGI